MRWDGQHFGPFLTNASGHPAPFQQIAYSGIFLILLTPFETIRILGFGRKVVKSVLLELIEKYTYPWKRYITINLITELRSCT
jgi:hypothetical protein